MSKYRQIRIGFSCVLIAQLLLMLSGGVAASAPTPSGPKQQAFEAALLEHLSIVGPTPADNAWLPMPGDGPSQVGGEIRGSVNAQETTLAVSIVSSPWAPLDHNNPGGIDEEVPQVFIVEAEVTNTGAEPATDLVVNLDYNEDPLNNWILLPGEDPDRTLDELGSGETYQAYWFARYSSEIDASHQYTVTASADNAGPVSTSENFYGELDPGETVQTRSFLSAGNSGLIQTSASVAVGVAFTVTVGYDLGNDPQFLIFSPVGNVDFAPGAYRLVQSEVRLYNGTEESIVADRLYFPTLPDFAENAEVTYTFVALAPSDTRICSYTAIGYAANDKYDQFFCEETHGAAVPIEGSATLSMAKQGSGSVIQQGELLTYTIDYANTGTLPLIYAWIWDDVDTSIGSIVATSIDPPSDPDETTDSRIAWYIDDIAESGQPDSTGVLTLAIRIDGAGQDLADSTPLVNYASFGINQGSLPQLAAVTSTLATTIQAPTISIGKTAGQATAEPDEEIVYTLYITNSGSVAATGLVVTDVLPAEVSYTPGTASPPVTGGSGQTLVWDDLGPISPVGGEVLITIPVRVGPTVPDGTPLVNTMTVQYENPAGWVYDVQTATDTITVDAPVLSIAKSDFPDPVLTGSLLTYTLQYANNGPAAATNVAITDAVPANTTYQSCSGGSTCGESDGIVSWTIGTVPTDSTDSVSFSVLVSEELSTGDTIRNEDYGIVADQTDFIPGPLEITEVNRDAGFVEGYTFVDVDLDGVRDAGEVGLPGVTVSLPSATDPVQVTAGNGYYHFRVEFAGPISVTADAVGGYFQTTPGTAYTDNVLGITQTIHFGYAPTAWDFGVIYGTVFEDLNHDGVQGTGENGLPGVTVTSAEAVNSPVTTNELGWYTLSYEDTAGAVTVAETNLPFYVSTTPDERQANVSIGSSGDSPIDFGDFMGIKIAGQVFEDANTNGANDVAEGGVPGAVVAADGDSITTDSSGVYTLYLAIQESTPISVTETDPIGYRSTNAIPGADVSKVDNNTLRIDSPISGTVYSGDFGDVQATDVVTVSGWVWNDTNADGQLDSEPYLEGAVVSLSSGMSQTSGPDGSFMLYGPAGEVITVTETNPAGYASTNAIPGNDASKWDNDTLVVSPLSAGSTSEGNLFGDVLTSEVAVITGIVFDDADEDGVLDAGETGLPGITVTLETSAGDTNVVQTDSAGNYQFAVMPGTDARIASAGPGGAFYPTTPESVVVHPSTASVYGGNHFGYSDDQFDGVAVIYGVVFDDVNGNGQQEFGELGLAGAVITLDGGASVTTSGNGLITGTFTFSVTEAGVHTLEETNPPGYRSTTPDQVNVAIASLGESYDVKFGDTMDPGVATIYGTVFDDLNGNGLQDAVEPGLEGVVISVTVGGGGGVLTVATGAYGGYSFGLAGGMGLHTVSEQDPAKPGYRSTTPDEVILDIEPGNSYVVNFGDTAAGGFSSITGIVFNDTNGDGVQNPAELGIPGVLVSLSDGSTATTDAYGGYTLAVTVIGPLQVIETDPAGYHSTTPNVVTVTVAAMGQVYRVHFGDSDNALVTSIFGTVFDDQDASAAWDATEPALSGVTVAITGPGSDLPGPYVTNEWGQYTFQIESTGMFIVTETDPPGYVSTVAIPGSAAVTAVDNNTLHVQVASPGTDFGDNVFGDVQASGVVTISGYVWNDRNADGQPNGEPYLAGAVVSLSSGMAQTTGPDGAFLLYAPAGQDITVIETNPAGYVSTNAIPGNDAIKIDNDTLTVRSTLPAGQASTNNRFGDAQVCVVDAYEEDDRPQDASNLSSGLTQEHNFCEDATDWLALTAQAGHVYTITTSSWGRRADTFLALYDRDASTLLVANDDYEGTTDYSSRIVWQAPGDGVYYVRVTNRTELTGSVTEYEVWVELKEMRLIYIPLLLQGYSPVAASKVQPMGVIEHTCPDEYELDDTWQQARAIEPGAVQVHSFDSDPAHYAADKDFVWFRLWGGQTITFTVTPVAGTLTLLELYDAQGTALNVSSTAQQLVWTAPTAGRYHLSVSPRTTSFGCSDQAGYSLLMEMEPVLVIYIPLLMQGFVP